MASKILKAQTMKFSKGEIVQTLKGPREIIDIKGGIVVFSDGFAPMDRVAKILETNPIDNPSTIAPESLRLQKMEELNGRSFGILGNVIDTRRIAARRSRTATPDSDEHKTSLQMVEWCDNKLKEVLAL